MKQKSNKEILNDLKDLNKDDDITLSDIEDIELLFGEVNLPEPSENLFVNIMDKLEGVYEDESLEKAKARDNIFENIKSLLLSVRLQVSLLDMRFWVASIILFIVGVVNVKTNENFNVVLFSPIVSLFSMYYLYKGKYYNTSGMELACKYSMYEIVLARTIIIVCYNILFAIAMASINYVIWHVNIWVYLIISWLSPLLFSYSITLYLFYKKGFIESIVGSICVWSVYCGIFLNLNNSQYIKMSYGVFVCSNIWINIWINVNLVFIFLSMIILSILFKNMKNA